MKHVWQTIAYYLINEDTFLKVINLSNEEWYIFMYRL